MDKQETGDEDSAKIFTWFVFSVWQADPTDILGGVPGQEPEMKWAAGQVYIYIMLFCL